MTGLIFSEKVFSVKNNRKTFGVCKENVISSLISSQMINLCLNLKQLLKHINLNQYLIVIKKIKVYEIPVLKVVITYLNIQKQTYSTGRHGVLQSFVEPQKNLCRGFCLVVIEHIGMDSRSAPIVNCNELYRYSIATFQTTYTHVSM